MCTKHTCVAKKFVRSKSHQIFQRNLVERISSKFPHKSSLRFNDCKFTAKFGILLLSSQIVLSFCYVHAKRSISSSGDPYTRGGGYHKGNLYNFRLVRKWSPRNWPIGNNSQGKCGPNFSFFLDFLHKKRPVDFYISRSFVEHLYLFFKELADFIQPFFFFLWFLDFILFWI